VAAGRDPRAAPLRTVAELLIASPDDLARWAEAAAINRADRPAFTRDDVAARTLRRRRGRLRRSTGTRRRRRACAASSPQKGRCR